MSAPCEGLIKAADSSKPNVRDSGPSHLFGHRFKGEEGGYFPRGAKMESLHLE